MPPLFPVSVKAVVAHEGRVVLLKNERDEWELPGGRLERGETPEQCVTRELQEELGAVIRIDDLVDSWVYHVAGKEVLILAYRARIDNDPATFTISDEHQGMDWFALDQLDTLNLPEGYRRSIERAGKGPANTREEAKDEADPN